MMQEPFHVQQWLKSIDVWDEKYDYVMHNSHWLTSEWDPKCPQCTGGYTNQDLINLNETFDLYKSALAHTPENDTSMAAARAAARTTARAVAASLSSTTTKAAPAATANTTTTNGHQRAVTQQQPPKPLSNFELLTNPTATTNNLTQDFNPTSLQEIDNHEHAQPVVSRIPARIPRIPVRSTKNHDY